MTAASEVKDMPSPRIRKFNPGTLQSDEEIKTQFVVRNHELGIVLDVLRGNIHASSCQHVLVVAPRGRGKTMLLTRAAAEIRTDDQLSKRLFPVQFMEESQEIFSLADFWLDTLFHLGRESARSNPELARELRDTHAALSMRWHERALEEHARAAVLDAADRLDKKLVLMVENLQALSKNVDQDFGWKLRGVLQSEPQIMLLASATSRFKGLDDAEQPFFELFRIVGLEPLGTDECRQLWQVASGDKVSGRNMRPLEILTGGSPRLLVIVAGFARHSSLRQLMEELVTLIDEHTEYFRGHLEVFGRTERRVYVAVIDLWQLSKPGEIAARARINTRVVSTMLGRLVSRGAVTTEGSGKKRLYRATEPLYSIYFKLRRERNEAAIVENLIRFMFVFYNEEEQVEMFERLRLEAAESFAIREGLDRAVAALPQFGSLYSDAVGPAVKEPRPTKDVLSAHLSPLQAVGSAQPSVTIKEWYEQLSQDIEMAFRDGAFEKVIKIVDQAVGSRSSDSSQVPDSFAVWALHKKADAHQHLSNFKAAIAVYDEVIKRVGVSDEPSVQWRITTTMVSKGDALGKLGDLEAAISAYNDAVERVGASGEPHVQWRVATALVSKGDALGKLGDLEAAISAYDEVVERFGASEVTEVQEMVAIALIFKALSRAKSGDSEAAIMACNELIERFGTSDAPEVRKWVARALVDRGNACGNLNDPEAAIMAYDEVVERFGASGESDIQECVARALADKGDLLGKLGDLQAAIAVYDEVVKRFGASGESDFQKFVARALADKGDLLGKLGDLQAAIAVYDEVVKRFGASGESDFQKFVARALADKGDLLGKLGDLQAAISVYDEVVERFGASGEPKLQWRVATVLVDKGHALRELDDFEAAIVSYDDVSARFGGSEVTEVQEWVAIALVFKAFSIAKSRNWEAAIVACNEVIERFGANNESHFQSWVAKALAAKRLFAWGEARLRTTVLLSQGKHRETIDAFRSAYDVFEPGNEEMMGGMLQLVPHLIAKGVSPQEVVKILAGDKAKLGALRPLHVAVRQHAGEEVRAPVEVLKVAADIRERIKEEAAETTPAAS